MRTCVVCDGPLSGQQRLLCSKQCSNKRQNTSPAQVAARAKYRGTVETRCSMCSRVLRYSRLAEPVCRGCYREKQRAEAKRRAAQRRLDVAAAGTRGGVWISGPCRRCGQQFTGRWHVSAVGYCSSTCKHADAGARRRAVKASAFVERVWRQKIYQRDKWRCQLCGKPVNRTAVVPHPLAPVLDHVVPLAVGGTHEPANVQTAHFLCNSVKGDRGGGEQLALIG